MNNHLTSNNKKATKLTKSSVSTLAKVLNMIENDSYCPDIIQQVDSVIGLLVTVKKELLAGHLNHCLETKLKEDKDKTIQELLKVYNLSKQLN